MNRLVIISLLVFSTSFAMEKKGVLSRADHLLKRLIKATLKDDNNNNNAGSDIDSSSLVSAQAQLNQLVNFIYYNEAKPFQELLKNIRALEKKKKLSEKKKLNINMCYQALGPVDHPEYDGQLPLQAALINLKNQLDKSPKYQEAAWQIIKLFLEHFSDRLNLTNGVFGIYKREIKALQQSTPNVDDITLSRGRSSSILGEQDRKLSRGRSLKDLWGVEPPEKKIKIVKAKKQNNEKFEALLVLLDHLSALNSVSNKRVSRIFFTERNSLKKMDCTSVDD